MVSGNLNLRLSKILTRIKYYVVRLILHDLGKVLVESCKIWCHTQYFQEAKSWQDVSEIS